MADSFEPVIPEAQSTTLDVAIARPSQQRRRRTTTELPFGPPQANYQAPVRKDVRSFIATLRIVVKAKEKFKQGMERHARRRKIWRVLLLCVVLVVGTIGVAVTMREAGFRSVVEQLEHLTMVNAKTIGIQVEQYFREQENALRAVHSAVRRNDIDVLTWPRTSYQFLLSVLHTFAVSTIFVTAPGVGTYFAGTDWIAYSQEGNCTLSWGVIETAGVRTADATRMAQSIGCSHNASNAPAVTIGPPHPGQELSRWARASYTRDHNECTRHTCDPNAQMLGVTRTLAYHVNGSVWAAVGVERSVRALNRYLLALRDTSFEVSRGAHDAQIFVVSIDSGDILGSTAPLVSSDLEAGKRVNVESHPGMGRVQALMQKDADGSYAASVDAAHFPAPFGMVDVLEGTVLDMLVCTRMAETVIDRPEGWATCLYVPTAYYTTFAISASLGTLAVLLLGTVAFLCVDSNILRGNTLVQFLTTFIVLVGTFALWEVLTRHDILNLTNDLQEMIEQLVETRIYQVLNAPKAALAIVAAHRDLGTLVQGNYSRADIERGDRAFVDVLRIFPEIYMVYTGASFAVSTQREECTMHCFCDHASDSASCCHSWEYAQWQYHCGGLADNRFAFFHGAKRKVAGSEPVAFQVTGRDLWSVETDGRMHRYGYAATKWLKSHRYSGINRNWSAVDYATFYNPVARPWFHSALTTPEKGWSSVYLFSSADPRSGRRPLGITATRTTAQTNSNTAQLNDTHAIFVDAVDFTLSKIDDFLSTISFSSQRSRSGVDGVVFLMDLDGQLIGTSDGGAATVVYFEGAAEQRVRCTAAGCTTSGDGAHLTSPTVRLVYQELLRRHGSLHGWKASSEKKTLMIGHGHDAGPLLLSTSLISSGKGGINWILCVALNSDELLRPYEEEFAKAAIILTFTLVILVIIFAGLSTVNVNDVVDARCWELLQQCRRDARTTRKGWGVYDSKVANNVTPGTDFIEYCAVTRQRLMVDAEIGALLMKIRHQLLPSSWNAILWLEALFSKTAHNHVGPSFVKAIVDAKRDASADISGLSVAKFALHIGFTGSSEDGQNSLATLKKLHQFVENTEQHDWAWDAVVSAEEITAVKTAHIINSTGVVTRNLAGRSSGETRAFIDREWRTFSSTAFWAHVAAVMQTDSLATDQSGVLHKIEEEAFPDLLADTKNCELCHVNARRHRNRQRGTHSVDAMLCEHCKNSRETLDDFILFVCIATRFLKVVCTVRNFLLETRSDQDITWGTLMRGESEQEDELLSEFVGCVREHINDKSLSNIWSAWVMSNDLSFHGCVAEATEQETWQDLTLALQSVGFTGTMRDLQPLFSVIKSQHRDVPNASSKDLSLQMRATIDDWRLSLQFLTAGHQVTSTVVDHLHWTIRGDAFRPKLSKFLRSSSYCSFITLVCMLHMALAFVEAPAGSYGLDKGNRDKFNRQLFWSLMIGACCIVVYWVDLLLCALGGFFFHNRYSHLLVEPTSAAMSPSRPPKIQMAQIEAGLMTQTRFGHMVALTVVVAIISTDWLCQLVRQYSTGPVHLDDGFVLILPYSTVLRPLTLILRSDELRASWISFFNTLYHSRNVFLLFAMVLIFFGSTSVVISAERQNVDGMFANIFGAGSTLFTYMTTAENWPDVVWPATRCDDDIGKNGTGHVSGGCWKYTNHVFFVVASILGSIVLIAVIIGTFEAKFTEQYKRRAGNRRQRQLEGIIASFAVLDAASSRPCNGLLTANEVLEFFAFCGLDHINLGKLGQGFGMQLDISDYAELCEEILEELDPRKVREVDSRANIEEARERLTLEIRQQSSFNLLVNSGFNSHFAAEVSQHTHQGSSSIVPHRVRPSYHGSTFHYYMMMVISVLHVTVLASTNTGFHSDTIDATCWVFFCTYKLDLLLRIRAGWCAFWNVPEDFYTQSKNRYDFAVSSVALILLLVALIQALLLSGVDDVQMDDGIASNSSDTFIGLPSWNRIILSVEGLRIFSSVERVRIIWFSIVSILPKYSDIFVLGLFAMYCFACIGCWLLAGSFRFMDESAYEIEQANFNSMLDALTTLFQLFIGEAWNDVKQAAVDSKNGGFVEIFFLAYVLCMTTLLSNLIAGVILSSFSVVGTIAETERRNSTLSVRQFRKLTDFRPVDNSRLDVRFEAQLDRRSLRIVPSNRSIFALMDPEHSGKVSKAELAECVGDQAATLMLQRLDLDDDAEISIAELRRAV